MMLISNKVKVLAVDFDGTLCDIAWPEIGEPNQTLIQLLILVREQGVKLILWTCRESDALSNAVQWCKEKGLEFDAINDNVQERIDEYGGNSRKISADWYIDDKGVDPFDFVSIMTQEMYTLMQSAGR